MAGRFLRVAGPGLGRGVFRTDVSLGAYSGEWAIVGRVCRPEIDRLRGRMDWIVEYRRCKGGNESYELSE